jgi:hypothetical protein
LNRKERKDHKEETSQALLFEFFVFFAVKIFLEFRFFNLRESALSAGNSGFACGFAALCFLPFRGH